jgi:hypothetical protein
VDLALIATTLRRSMVHGFETRCAGGIGTVSAFPTLSIKTLANPGAPLHNYAYQVLIHSVH